MPTAAAVYREICQDFSVKPNSRFTQELTAQNGEGMKNVIDLSDNLVGPNGSLAVATFMAQQGQNVHTLNLSQNNLKAEHVSQVLTILDRHPSLTSLNLSDNPISSLGGKDILGFVRRNEKIIEMVVEGTRINPAQHRLIRECIESHSVQKRSEPRSPTTRPQPLVGLVEILPTAPPVTQMSPTSFSLSLNKVESLAGRGRTDHAPLSPRSQLRTLEQGSGEGVSDAAYQREIEARSPKNMSSKAATAETGNLNSPRFTLALHKVQKVSSEVPENLSPRSRMRQMGGGGEVSEEAYTLEVEELRSPIRMSPRGEGPRVSHFPKSPRNCQSE